MKLTHIMAGTALLFSGFAAGSVAVGLSASATTPTITFYACLNVKAGTMNNISTTKAPKCATGNINISWNATGPKGDTGTNGTNGAKGDTGQQGPAPDGGFYTVLAPLMSNGDLPYYGTCANGSITHIRANGAGQVFDYANPSYPVRLGAMFYCPF